MKTRSRVLLVVLILLAVLVVYGSLRGNRVSTSTNGREIVGLSRNLLSAASLSAELTQVSLTLGTHAATITPQSVSLDGGAPITIPAACRQVEIRETGTGLVVSLDGVAAP